MACAWHFELTKGPWSKSLTHEWCLTVSNCVSLCVAVCMWQGEDGVGEGALPNRSRGNAMDDTWYVDLQDQPDVVV